MLDSRRPKCLEKTPPKFLQPKSDMNCCVTQLRVRLCKHGRDCPSDLWHGAVIYAPTTTKRTYSLHLNRLSAVSRWHLHCKSIGSMGLRADKSEAIRHESFQFRIEMKAKHLLCPKCVSQRLKGLAVRVITGNKRWPCIRVQLFLISLSRKMAPHILQMNKSGAPKCHNGDKPINEGSEVLYFIFMSPLPISLYLCRQRHVYRTFN
jgi:hypothetical protein